MCVVYSVCNEKEGGTLISGAPHKKIGPSDGGWRRLLYRLYFNADGTCNTKEKKSWIEIRTSRAQPKLFMGGENFPFFSMAVASTFFGIQKDWAFPFWYEIYAKRTKHFFGIWHIIRRWHLAKIWTCKRNWGYPPGSYISPPSLISRRLIFRTCPQRHSTVKIFCWQKGKWEILFTSQSLSIWISFFFSSLLLAESLTFLWNVNASLTRPYPKHFLTFGTRHVTRTALQFNRLTIEVHALNFHPFQIFCWF